MTAYNRHVQPAARERIQVGMPTIPLAILDCVVYLYPSGQMARDGVEFGGSGFIVGVPSVIPTAHFLYVVSNYHVAVKGSPVIRLNTKDGGIDVIEYDVADWQTIPNGGDIAAAPLPLNRDIHKFEWVSTNLLLTPDEAARGYIGVGDDVFMVGRFIDHDGGQTNAPAVRFGNISINPSYIPGCSNSGASTRYYCLDMHSRTGSSGGPIFAYRTPGSDLNSAFTNTIKMSSTVLRLLGIHCGQFPETMSLQGSKSVIVGYSGMTHALPASAIAALLNCDRFMAHRNEVESRWRNTGKLPIEKQGE